MTVATHDLTFNGGLLERGFWLYVWEITTPEKAHIYYYVGRTGDSSSLNAQSPFNRMGQHLGFRKQSNALRRLLKAKEVEPEQCVFRLIAHGPIMEEGTTREEHRPRRDRIAALEKALADGLTDAGYDVINMVNSRAPLDPDTFASVLTAFASRFPNLRPPAVSGPMQRRAFREELQG